MVRGTSTTDSIQVGQGFFVASQNAGPHTFKYGNWGSTKSDIEYDEQDTKQMVVSVKTGSGKEKDAYITFSPEAENGFDVRDAWLLKALDKQILEPYFVVDDNNVVDNQIQTVPACYPLNIHNVDIAQTADIVFNGIPDDVDAYLIDRNDTIALQNGYVYTTNISKSENTDRFKILLKDGNVGIEDGPLAEENGDGISLWYSNKQIHINAQNAKELIVVNSLGQTEMRTKVSSNICSENVNLKQGVYLATLLTDKSRKTIKIVVTE